MKKNIVAAALAFSVIVGCAGTTPAQPDTSIVAANAQAIEAHMQFLAADALAGLQLLQSDTRIDVLVTDVGLPGGLDGRQMADKGRQSRPALPVLFMTGYAHPQVLDDRPLDHATAVLTKPFALEALTSTVSALLRAP